MVTKVNSDTHWDSMDRLILKEGSSTRPKVNRSNRQKKQALKIWGNHRNIFRGCPNLAYLCTRCCRAVYLQHLLATLVSRKFSRHNLSLFTFGCLRVAYHSCITHINIYRSIRSRSLLSHGSHWLVVLLSLGSPQYILIFLILFHQFHHFSLIAPLCRKRRIHQSEGAGCGS